MRTCSCRMSRDLKRLFSSVSGRSCSTDMTEATPASRTIPLLNSAIEGRPGSYYPVPADCSRFNHIPIAELDDERDDSRVGKVNVTDLIASFSQHIAITELNELQIRLNGAKDSTRKRCEQSIG
jgi:hypothetical protein